MVTWEAYALLGATYEEYLEVAQTGQVQGHPKAKNIMFIVVGDQLQTVFRIFEIQQDKDGIYEGLKEYEAPKELAIAGDDFRDLLITSPEKTTLH
jgi:hypothetical protein